MIDDPYKVLGISRDASDEEIKQAYRRLAKQYHPDRNPGDATAAQKMQQINAAYEQIKNPDKGQPNYGSRQYGYSQGSQADAYQSSAYNYIRYGRYREALRALENCTHKDGQWYYLSALAHQGLGNRVTALEHIRRAVSMDPDNLMYQQVLTRMEYGGTSYRQQAGNYKGFTMKSNPFLNLCLCYLLQMLCCRC